MLSPTRHSYREAGNVIVFRDIKTSRAKPDPWEPLAEIVAKQA
jgi:hypothetical protein